MSEHLQWFHEARYGMFIHWGAYSVAARGEWVLNRERIPYDEYTRKYVDHFHAENYDPKVWVRLAKDAGMKYMVMTTRHHDGFAMWDTKTTDFNAVKMGPRKDLVLMFVEAARAEGLKAGLYYSVADWSHPDYPDAYCRDWPSEWTDEDGRQRFVRFYQAQLEELMTNYGRIDLLWYDGCIPAPTDGDAVNAMVKQLQPHILTNERNDGLWDFHCCEQAIRPAKEGQAWEACMTLNENWAYHAGDQQYKSAKQVISLLTETASKAGNLLLNVGPKADGSIPEEAERILTDAGDWLRRNGEFLPFSSRSPFSWNNSGRLTVKGSKIYLHLFHSPGEVFCLAEIKNKVKAAYYMDSKCAVAFDQREDRLFLRELPVPLPDRIATTIVLEVEGEPEAIRPQTSFWIPG